MERHCDIRAWKIFLRIIEKGTIAKASEGTLLEASNVSRIVLSLEASLGIKLFFRESPVRLTEEGARILPLAKSLVKAHKEILRQRTPKEDGLNGIVRIGLPPSFFDRLLLKHFLKFSKEYPRIQIATSDYRKVPPIIFEQDDESLDLILTFGPDDLLDKSDQLYLGPCQRFPLASPKYLRDRGLPKNISDLASHTLLRLQRPLIKTGDYLISTGELDIVSKFKESISYTSPTSLKTATLLGGGIHHGMPAIYCFEEIAKGDLVILNNIWDFPTKDYYLFVNPESKSLSRVTLVKNFLLEVLKGEFINCQKVLESVFNNYSE